MAVTQGCSHDATALWNGNWFQGKAYEPQDVEGETYLWVFTYFVCIHRVLAYINIEFNIYSKLDISISIFRVR